VTWAVVWVHFPRPRASARSARAWPWGKSRRRSGNAARRRGWGQPHGITDPRRDTHLDFVGGIRGAAELERRVQSDGWSLGLYLYPTRIEQLMKVSNAGLLMPPKSTWFEPKLRSGLFLHAF
jgi:hypothetical protein